jgi:hypothetical protein
MEDIIVPIVFFVAGVGIVAIVFNYLHNEKKRYYTLMEKVIESGQPLPENFLSVKKAEKRSFEYFKNGIIFSFLSAAFWALFLWGYFDNQPDDRFPFLFIAAFFTAFGLAFLLIGWLRKNQEKNEEKAKNE